VTRARARRRRRERRFGGATLVRALVVLAAFVFGVALGASLDDNPRPGMTTIDRTITIVTGDGGTG